jgi:hypothetical protein
MVARLTGPNFREALENDVADHPDIDFERLLAESKKHIGNKVSKLKGSVGTILSFLFKAWGGDDTKPSDALKKFLITLSNNYSPLTIIVDEANVYFNVVQAQNVRDILSMLIALSKQENKLNVILSSSEFLFPYQLNHLGFKAAHIHQHIVMGDVPPSDMYALLTEKWHVRPHLATALINQFGGHLLQLSRAVSDLALKKEKYLPLSTYGSTFSGEDSPVKN